MVQCPDTVDGYTSHDTQVLNELISDSVIDRLKVCGACLAVLDFGPFRRDQIILPAYVARKQKFGPTGRDQNDAIAIARPLHPSKCGEYSP